MKPVFNGPVVPNQLQKPIWAGELRGGTGQTIDSFVGTNQSFADAATQTEHLSYPWPGFGEKVILDV